MIAVKNMKMPSCCAECPMYQSEDSDYCNITGEWITGEEMKRHKDCPLVEIITCKDCKHCDFDNSDQTFFCNAYGNLICPSHFCAESEEKNE